MKKLHDLAEAQRLALAIVDTLPEPFFVLDDTLHPARPRLSAPRFEGPIVISPSTPCGHYDSRNLAIYGK